MSAPSASREGDVSERVGEGPLYTPLRDAAAALVNVWSPPERGPYQNSWGVGNGMTLVALGDGKHRLQILTFEWDKLGPGHAKSLTLQEVRAAAISMLVYCAARERQP